MLATQVIKQTSRHHSAIPTLGRMGTRTRARTGPHAMSSGGYRRDPRGRGRIWGTAVEATRPNCRLGATWGHRRRGGWKSPGFVIRTSAPVPYLVTVVLKLTNWRAPRRLPTGEHRKPSQPKRLTATLVVENQEEGVVRPRRGGGSRGWPAATRPDTAPLETLHVFLPILEAVEELKQARERRHPTRESRKRRATHRRHGIETPVRGPASGRSPSTGCNGAGGSKRKGKKLVALS
jgi:hypothetical protein